MATRFQETALERELIERYQPEVMGRKDGAGGRPITASDPNEWEQKIVSDFHQRVNAFCRRLNDQQTDCVARFLSSMQRYRSLQAEIQKLEELGDERENPGQSGSGWERLFRILSLGLFQGSPLSMKKKRLRQAQKECHDAFAELNDIYGHFRKYLGAHQREIEQLGSHYVKVVNLYRRNFEQSNGEGYPGGPFTIKELISPSPCQCRENDLFPKWFQEATRTVAEPTHG